MIGKKSLRERNISEMMKTDVENWYELELTYVVLSNQNLDSELKLNKVYYPVISSEDFKTQNTIDSLDTRVRFSLSSNKADSIFKSNIDSLYQTYPEESYSTHSPSFSFSLFNNSLFRYFAISQSKRDFSIDKKAGGWCEYLKSENHKGYLRCMVSWNEIIILEEDIKSSTTFYTEQKLTVQTVGSDFWYDREEKLVWLFYKWMQIDWIDGNGLGGDDPSSKRKVSTTNTIQSIPNS
ncbi:MAG: hypothetical protein JXR11_14195 [Balneola sp.]